MNCTVCGDELAANPVAGLDGRAYCDRDCQVAWVMAGPTIPPRTAPTTAQIAAYITGVVPEHVHKAPPLYQPTRGTPRHLKSNVRKTGEVAVNVAGFIIWLAVISLVAMLIGIPLML